MIAAIRDDNPVIFVEHRLLYPTEAPVPVEPFVVEFGRARVMRRGEDLTIVGISNMAVECLRAAELLADAGIAAEVIDPVWLAPLDVDTIIQSAEQTGRLLVVDNAWTNCGASAEIIARVAERPVRNRSIRFERMGFAATTCPTTPALEQEFYPNSEPDRRRGL
jgi:pyruvate dehydrogenase E1 component beta subunit